MFFRYFQLADDVDDIHHKASVYFLDINSVQLKGNLITHCEDWANRLIQLLFKIANDRIEEMYEYCHVNGKRYVCFSSTNILAR